jgi:hypothetical protein
LNNPVRYTDPTGHRVCEDDGGGTCLSEKQETDKYKAKLHKHKDKVKDKDKEKPSSCPSCVITGGAVIIAAGALELTFGGAAVAAVVLSGPAAIAPIALVFTPIEAVLANISLIGIEEVVQGEHRAPEDVHIDYLPLLHAVTNPNEDEYFK